MICRRSRAKVVAQTGTVPLGVPCCRIVPFTPIRHGVGGSRSTSSPAQAMRHRPSPRSGSRRSTHRGLARSPAARYTSSRPSSCRSTDASGLILITRTTSLSNVPARNHDERNHNASDPPRIHARRPSPQAQQRAARRGGAGAPGAHDAVDRVSPPGTGNVRPRQDVRGDHEDALRPRERARSGLLCSGSPPSRPIFVSRWAARGVASASYIVPSRSWVGMALAGSSSSMKSPSRRSASACRRRRSTPLPLSSAYHRLVAGDEGRPDADHSSHPRPLDGVRDRAVQPPLPRRPRRGHGGDIRARVRWVAARSWANGSRFAHILPTAVRFGAARFV